MKIADIRLLLLVALLLRTIPLSALEFSIEPEARQTMKGWGCTPGPIDWDGRSVLRDPTLMQQLYSGSGLTVARLLLGTGGLYFAEGSGGINGQRTADILLPQIAALQKYGISTYVISMVLPPSVLRKYRSDEHHMELDPNVLRPELEDDYVAFLVTIIELLKARGATLPMALSVQRQPDFPTQSGCPYAPEQWAQLVSKVRHALDQAGFNKVGLIGPETIRPAWTLAAFQGRETRHDPLPLTGLAITSFARSAVDDSAHHMLGTLLQRIMKEGTDVWTTDIDLTHTTTDTDVLISTFTQMQRDLVEYGASYWFWRYGFNWTSGPEALIHGRTGTNAPVFSALRTLWNAAPAGSRVHALRIRSDELGGMVDEGVIGFGLRNSLRTVVVLVNSSGVVRQGALGGVSPQKSLAHFFAYDDDTGTFSYRHHQGPFEGKLPPKSVVFVVIE